MAMILAWQGLDNVLRNLNNQVNEIKGNSLMGLIRGAAYIRKSMDTTPPLIPIDTGNMTNSWFIVTNNEGVRAGRSPKFKEGPRGYRDTGKLMNDHVSAIATAGSAIKGKEPALAIGFSAGYAWYVHENVGANFKRPGAGAKFLEAAIANSTDKILEMVRLEARI